MFQKVPIFSIAAMLIAAVVSILIPVIAFVILKKKTKGNPVCIIIGAATFVVFSLVLETLLHQIVFRFFGEQLNSNIWLYALYGGLAAGLFEETGRYFSMKLFMKKMLIKDNSLMYGVGHGGIEAILLVGLTYISNAAVSLLINFGKLESLLSSLDEAMKQQVVEQYSALWTTPSDQFLLAAAERVFAFLLQLCLSYMVYRAIRFKKPIYYIIAVAIHFAVDAVFVVLSKNTSVYVAEALLAVCVLCIALITFWHYGKERITEDEEKGGAISL